MAQEDAQGHTSSELWVQDLNVGGVVLSSTTQSNYVTEKTESQVSVLEGLNVYLGSQYLLTQNK